MVEQDGSRTSDEGRPASSLTPDSGEGGEVLFERVFWTPRILTGFISTFSALLSLSGFAAGTPSALLFTGLFGPPALAWAIYAWGWSCRLRLDQRGVRITAQVPWVYKRSWEEITRFEGPVTRGGYLCLAIRTSRLQQEFKPAGCYRTANGTAMMQAVVAQLENIREARESMDRRPPAGGNNNIDWGTGSGPLRLY